MTTLFNRSLFMLAAVAVLGLAAAGCGPTETADTVEEPAVMTPADTETSAEAEPEAAAEAPEEPAADELAATLAPPEGSEPKENVDAQDTPALAGTTGPAVTGRVTFDGETPRRRPLDTEADPACAVMHADSPLRSDQTVVSEDGGVYWAFAYIKNPPKQDYPIPSEPAKIDQVGCRYTPHVMGMRAGQDLNIHNSDDTTHNVRTFPSRGFDGKYINKTINFGQPGIGMRTQVFENPEKAIKVKCDIHPWMEAYIFAMEHPYFDTTDENGDFRIATEGLPAGEYDLVVWHEKWGEQTQTITVGEDGTATADFTYSE